ncbi:unnamed protein product [Polarella glacialis]|uniref:SET domain-containing protein n=1 Tax=Polarella glacialis TaxID=89957 RepID=A0A813FLK7_POLGL|nr:unnamed protein product [Polarella glacialis]CAE8661800.1 unnamed protein product [Polarella glacialis]
MDADAVHIVATEFGFGLQCHHHPMNVGDIFCREEPCVSIHEADMMDMAMCDDVLGLPVTSRYGKIGILLLKQDCLSKVLAFCEGRQELFSPSFLSQVSIAAREMSEDFVEGADTCSDTQEKYRQALISFQSNAWRGPGDGRFSLYQTICRANHSCSPNALVGNDNGKGTFTALQTIAPGDEIRPSYVSVEVLESSVMERRQVLAQGWGFWCGCHRCMSEASCSRE